jgi:hypothetical protein
MNWKIICGEWMCEKKKPVDEKRLHRCTKKQTNTHQFFDPLPRNISKM